jgi:NAD(P) transhydrogenase subunit alpha
MGEDFARRQREHITEALKKIDIALCTALIPGRKAPILITKEMVAVMRPGSVIVDLAVEQGGNVEGSKPGEDVTTANGVTILGHLNLPSHIAVDASQLYAKNLLAFLGLIIDKDKSLKIDPTDEIVKASLLTRDGAIVHPQLAGA